MQDYRFEGKTIQEHLLLLAEKGNKAFAVTLNPGVENVLGLRIPDLRKLAVRIAKADWENYLSSAGTYYMEERMLQGMVLGSIRPDSDVEVYLERVTRFVRLINSWSVCDTFKFGGGKKFVANHEDRLWIYLKEWMQAEGEYEIRFGIVMAMTYFIDEAHITEYFSCLDSIHHEGYYVKMAVAWALSVCFVKFPEKTMSYLQKNSLDTFTYNKALQKICESYRVEKEIKSVIKAMKR